MPHRSEAVPPHLFAEATSSIGRPPGQLGRLLGAALSRAGREGPKDVSLSGSAYDRLSEAKGRRVTEPFITFVTFICHRSSPRDWVLGPVLRCREVMVPHGARSLSELGESNVSSQCSQRSTTDSEPLMKPFLGSLQLITALLRFLGQARRRSQNPRIRSIGGPGHWSPKADACCWIDIASWSHEMPQPVCGERIEGFSLDPCCQLVTPFV